MTSPAQPKAAQRQLRVTVSGITGTFATKSGGDVTADYSRVYDGGDPHGSLLAGPATADDVTIGRPFAPARDVPALKALRGKVGRHTATITIEVLDADLVATSDDALVYTDALLIGLTDPEADASSADAAMFELTFAIPRVPGAAA